MKKLIALLLAVVMVLGLVACGNSDAPETTAPAANGDTTPVETTAPVAEVEDVTIKVWAPQEDQVDANSWLPQVQAAFAAAHPEYNITWENGVCSEGDAKTLVSTDPAAAADVYMYANDQLGELIAAGALAKLGGAYLEQVQNDVSGTYVNTVTYTDGGVYGFPVACNTWFMYYNKSVYTEEDVKSLETMLEKGVVAFPMTTGWYAGAIFLGNGCTLFGETGTDAAAGMQFGGEAGYAAAAKMVELAANPNFRNDADGLGNTGLKDGTVAAYFSGDWEYDGLYEVLGENLGAVCLPTVNINGTDVSMKAFAGSKAVGVNPNAKYMKAAMEFAAYMASAESQLLRFQLRNITPAVTALAENADVQASLIASAQSATMAYTSSVQPTITEMGNYWSPIQVFGENIINGVVTADNIQEMVDALVESLNNTGL